jgi:CubicO group peptidase (beta-lactamase class C family)
MFHIASITKTVTASAVLLLVDAGLIALDEPIAPYLDFAIAGEQASRITIRQLLMHTSGISDDVYYETDFRSRGTDADMALGTLLREYLAPGGQYTGVGNVKRVPGSRWEYSNIGFSLLGYLGDRICGTDMRAFIRERLVRPLGLRHIAWTIAETPARLRATPYDLDGETPKPTLPVGAPDWPSSMIRASIGDLTLLVAAAANGGVARGVRLLSAASNAEMLSMKKPEGLPAWLTGQGLGWQESPLAGIPRANHWGGDPGVFTMAYLDPDRRAGVVLLSNLSATPESRNALRTIAAKAFEGVAD